MKQSPTISREILDELSNISDVITKDYEDAARVGDAAEDDTDNNGIGFPIGGIIIGESLLRFYYVFCNSYFVLGC